MSTDPARTGSRSSFVQGGSGVCCAEVTGASVDDKLDKIFMDYLENEVLEHADVVQAVRAGGNATSQFPRKTELVNWDTLK